MKVGSHPPGKPQGHCDCVSGILFLEQHASLSGPCVTSAACAGSCFPGHHHRLTSPQRAPGCKKWWQWHHPYIPRKLELYSQAQGLAIRKEAHASRVPRSQRGGDIVEPLVREQWFVRMEPLAAPALQVTNIALLPLDLQVEGL